ncbi:MAG: hypothetical protein FJ088_13740 [Deltaproteobacteria bacterium]|nr:hypothetical protein [Deltaproteobacteria bacterium]
MTKKTLMILVVLFHSCDGNVFQQLYDAEEQDGLFFETEEQFFVDFYEPQDIAETGDHQFYEQPDVFVEKYSEPLDEKKDISGPISAYSQSKWYETLIALLDLRYKTGHFIVTNVKNPKNQAQNYAKTSSAQELIKSASTVVHELNHFYNFEKSSYYNYTYRIRHDLEITVAYFDTFPRNEILQYVTWDDFYADTYLTGAMGKQGFDSVLEEFNAYIQSLFTDFSFVDQFNKNIYISSRDGVITFMIYTALYLRHARTNEPKTYEKITSNQKWRDLILTLFGRAEFILETTDKYKNLGIDDDMLAGKFEQLNLRDEFIMIMNYT